MTDGRPEPSDLFDVFVSHAAEDREVALRLEAALQQHHYRCFLAVDDLNELVRTQQWSEALEGILATSPVLVVLVTPNALRSKWVKFEWRSFHDDILSGHRAGLIVPVLWKHDGVGTLPTALRHWQMVDVVELGEERCLDELAKVVNGFRLAAQGSKSELERHLPWSFDALAAAGGQAPSLEGADTTTRPLARDPQSLLPLRVRDRRLTLAGAVAAAALAAVVAFRGGLGELSRSHPATPPDQVLSQAGPRVAAAAPTAEPREGWAPIEAFMHPTLANRNLLSRLETWSEAKQAFESKCEQRPCSSRERSGLYFASGEHARLSGKREEARDAFTAAISADTKWALPLVASAMVLIATDPGLALGYARDAHRADPSLWIALPAKATAFAKEGHYVSALQELIEARARAPSDCIPLLDGLLAMTYHSEALKNEKAEELALSACTPEARVASACTVLAEQALEKSDPDAALHYVEVADREDFVPLLLAQGDAHQAKKRLPQAWAAWGRAAALKERAEMQGAPPERMRAVQRAVGSKVAPPPRAPERSSLGAGG